jgi:hypothetical protein
MKITKEVVNNTASNFISLDELAFLYSLEFNENWLINLSPASTNKLVRMGLIENDSITTYGSGVVYACLDEKEEVIKPVVENKFDEIWLKFPRDDSYRHFTTTRPIRWNKKETKIHYSKALETHTHEQLLKALKNEIDYRAANSTQENLFKYMKGSVNWFKDQSYLNFIEDEEIKLDNEFGKEIS